MSTRARRRTTVRVLSGVSIAVLALAGCSGSDEPAAESSSPSAATDDGGEPTGESSSEQTQSGGEFDKAAAQEVLLTAEEMGAGYTEVPQEQVAAALSQSTAGLGEMIDTIQVEPAACATAMQDAMSRAADMAEVMDQTAVAMFTKGTDFATESLAPSSMMTGELSIPDGCEQMTITVAGITAEASLTPVEIGLGDDSMGMIMQISMNVGGQQVDQTSAQSVVVQGDAAMSLSLSGADATEQGLADLTNKAFEKAEPVFG